MRKFLVGLLFLTAPLFGAGTQNQVTVNTGTVVGIDAYLNADGANRQAIVIGDFSSSDTVRVDPTTGIAVHLATSSLTTSTALKVDGSAVNQPVINATGASLAITSTNTLTVNGSGVNQPVINATGASLAITSTNTLNVSQQGTFTTTMTGFPLTPTGVNASSVAVVNGASALSVTANAGTKLNTSA